MPEHVRTPSCAGVDGCPGGWLVATRAGVQVVADFATIVGEFEVIGVDMPIGMPPPMPRVAEFEARRFISPRGSTIFPTPPRICLEARSYREACELAASVTGARISKQAWNILPKIAEIDAVLGACGHRQVIEVHPECSFTAMNADRPLVSKHTPPGRAARTALIEQHYGPLAPPPRGAKADDVLDAFAVLWSTERFVAGTHRQFPATLRQHDACGLLMQIIT